MLANQIHATWLCMVVGRAAVQTGGICVVLPFWLYQMDKMDIVTWHLNFCLWHCTDSFDGTSQKQLLLPKRWGTLWDDFAKGRDPCWRWRQHVSYRYYTAQPFLWLLLRVCLETLAEEKECWLSPIGEGQSLDWVHRLRRDAHGGFREKGNTCFPRLAENKGW